MQCLTDANLKILNVVARWPGSLHDATIFANSAIRARFEAGHFSGTVIIGRLQLQLFLYLLSMKYVSPYTKYQHCIFVILSLFSRGNCRFTIKN